MTRRLWAPWRSKFINGPKAKTCIFCSKPRERRDRHNLIVRRGQRVYSMLNLFPYNGGHTLVSPYRHIGDWDQLTRDELNELFEETRTMIGLLKKALKPQGFNVGMNLGEAGGASFAAHLHVHVVPRWNGDTNFMPVTQGTKVISQSLEETYRRLTGPTSRRKAIGK